ncbi:MAG: GNAT family N-acetyltransferase [Bryobacteraceae bacterium]
MPNLLEALEANLHGHIAYVQRQLPGMTVENWDDLLLVDSHLPTDTFNKIARARLRDADAHRRVSEAIGHFRSAGRPFAWWVGPCSQPSGLGRLLEAHGLQPAESELGMAAGLTRLPTTHEFPAGLEIRRARSREEVADFADVTAANWDSPDPSVLAFYDMAAPLLLLPECPMQLFVGYLDGRAAAAGELFLGGGVAGLHMVSTRREFQRRGIGLAMTWHLSDQGRRQGFTIATLQASEAGRGVYARIGYTACCELIEYQPV